MTFHANVDQIPWLSLTFQVAYEPWLTNFCPPFQHLLSQRLTSLSIIGAPRVPPLNPSETIVLSEHYRLWEAEFHYAERRQSLGQQMLNGGHEWELMSMTKFQRGFSSSWMPLCLLLILWSILQEHSLFPVFIFFCILFYLYNVYYFLFFNNFIWNIIYIFIMNKRHSSFINIL